MYALTASHDNTVALWDVSQGTCISSRATPHVVTQLAWHPTANEAALVTSGGELAIWREIVDSDMASPLVMEVAKKLPKPGAMLGAMLESIEGGGGRF